MENETQENINSSETDEAEIKTETKEENTTSDEVKTKPTKLKQFLQFLIFTGFSISAGVIQFVSTGVLSTWTGWIPYWIAYLIGLVLSVVWNFTFNRKFTFKAANNVPLAMGLVVIYYCAFTPLSTFGADAIVDAWEASAGENWNADYEMVITAAMMILNFLTEFLWDKFVVFNEKVTDAILRLFRKKKADATDSIQAENTQEPSAEECAAAVNEEEPQTEDERNRSNSIPQSDTTENMQE